jgi:DNA-binding PadR family transcriptional regulator
MHTDHSEHHHHGHHGHHHHHHECHGASHGHGRGGRGFDGERDGGGMGRGGRGGERPERVFGRGDLPLIVLALIEISPRHGYEIIKAIEERCGGAYAPSPGAVYPTLTLLEEQDQVTAGDSAGGKKLYTITDLGRSYLQDNRDQVAGIFTRLDMVARMQARKALPERVHQGMHTLKHALLLHASNWSEAEAQRVCAILEHAANQIIDAQTVDAPAKEQP